jgi:uncharacterized membrane protein
MEQQKGASQAPLQKVKSFLKRKDIEFSVKRYAIDALGAMAQGLFASLLIGTIFNTIGNLSGLTVFNTIGGYASGATGAAMAIAIGYALKCPPLVLFTLAGVGMATNALGGAGGPLAVLVITIFAAEFGKAVSKETKVDIIVTPAVTLAVGVLLALWWAPAIGKAASAVGQAIMWATNLQPFFMGILVSVIIGIALTLPISSAAICAALGLVGLAGGAAVAGCCAHMVGFAVMSFRENGWGGLAAQGVGTSMLQMPNLVKNPRAWIPPVAASAITGPLATCVFKLKMNGAPVSSGMGTSGLVGQIGVITGWFSPSEAAVVIGEAAIAPGFMDWLGFLMICFVLPALLTWLIAIPFRKFGWIKDGDLDLNL